MNQSQCFITVGLHFLLCKHYKPSIMKLVTCVKVVSNGWSVGLLNVQHFTHDDQYVGGHATDEINERIQRFN